MQLCYSCNTQKPESEFYNDSHGTERLKTWCKSCCADYNKRYHQAHPEKRKEAFRRRMEDPIKRAVYNARKAEYRRVITGAIPRHQWIELVRSHKTKKLEEKIQLYSTSIAIRYGQHLADLYLEKPFISYSKTENSGPKLKALKAKLISKLTGISPVLQSTIRRVEDLNHACNLPLMNIGWHCLSCGLSHSDPRFFEVDHITPKSHGGQDQPNNKQCLCPNCHKKKTLQIDSFQPTQSFKQVNSLQLSSI